MIRHCYLSPPPAFKRHFEFHVHSVTDRSLKKFGPWCADTRYVAGVSRWIIGFQLLKFGVRFEIVLVERER